MSLLSIAATVAGAALAAESLLTPVQLFHPPAGPVQIRLDALAVTSGYQAVLLAPDGTLITESGRLEPGTFDLLDIMPQVAELKQAAYLQMIVDGAPSDAPLVIQPLLNRPLVRTTQAMRPDGTTKYTRIIGWGDSLFEPGNADHQKLQSSWPKGEPIVHSGYRIYAEEDAILSTSMGDIRVAFRPDHAPNTVWNFMELARGGFYTNTLFHRIVPMDRDGRPFVIQGGDPTGTGDGGPGWDLPLEPSTLPHDFGVISMARSDPPDSAGSQFFFGLSREGTARLDGQYCAFGCAVDGADVLMSMSALPIASPQTGRPVEPPTLLKVTLVEAPPRTPGKGRPDQCVSRPAPVQTEPPATNPSR